MAVTNKWINGTCSNPIDTSLGVVFLPQEEEEEEEENKGDERGAGERN